MVLQASVGNKPITPLEYLILWIGAMGASVGLTVPVELAVEAKDPMPSSIRLQF
jgi:ubiquitin-like-conjugating enzyme ATG10